MLDNSSETHSENMAVRNFFAHCDLDTGDLPWDRMTAAGYSWISAAENIAAGQTDPASVMSSWINSPLHLDNILSTDTREIGGGYEHQAGDTDNVRKDLNSDCSADSFGNGPYFHYWTLNFGSRANDYPVVINREAYETLSPNVDLYVYDSGSTTEMRFRNEPGAWSGWEAYVANKQWSLSPGDGVKKVRAETRDSNTATVWAASDTILLIADCTALHELYLSNQTITDVQSYEACITIFADNGFHVADPGGDVTFRAPRIVLSNGFSVAKGAVFHVISEVP